MQLKQKLIMKNHITLLIPCLFTVLLSYGQYNPIETNHQQHHITKSKYATLASNNLNNWQKVSSKSENAKRQKLDSIIRYNFNEATNSWDKKYLKDSYTYDDNFKETDWVYSSWSESDNSWKGLLKARFGYDEEGNNTDYLEYTWGVNEQWNPTYKEHYTYNSNNELTETLKYTWKYSLGDWLLFEKKQYSYGADGAILKDSTYQLGGTSENWELKSKTEYTYIHGGLPYHIIKYIYESSTQQWIYNEDLLYLYDNIDWLLRSITLFKWNETDADWQRSEVTGFGYDENRGIKESNKVTWNANKQFTSMKKEYCSFDYNLSTDNLLLPYLNTYEQMYYHHQVTNKSLISLNEETELFEKYRELRYFYSSAENTTGINVIKQETANIYPNPAQGNITINYSSNTQWAGFELFDNQGRKILTTKVSNGENIDVSTIIAGVYFYRIIYGEKIQTGKLLID